MPYEFAHGYSASDLAGLRIKQVGDIGFITSRYGLLATQIQRRADNDWTAAVQALKNGATPITHKELTKAVAAPVIEGIGVSLRPTTWHRPVQASKGASIAALDPRTTRGRPITDIRDRKSVV